MSSKKNFSQSTTERYALALYELAQENSEIGKIELETKSIQELCYRSSEFRSLIKDPTNKKNEQLNAIKAMCDQFKFSKIFTKFLCFVCFKRRLFFIEKILINFLQIASKKRGEIKAQLSSSKELSPGELEKIQQELSENFASKIKLDYKYDSTLIGGLIIQIGSIMIDTSIKNKLKRLEMKMVEA